MSPERWQQIERLYEAALERVPGDRPAFLAEACGDADLRREVESLLAYEAEAETLLGVPAAEIAARAFAAEDDALPAGHRLGPYVILAPLGKGGMGEVYLARDERLGRKVAVKLLPPAYLTDPDRVRRFVLEARAASALNHPNILTIHEIGEADGHRLIVTEYVEGETLRQLMDRGPLPAGAVVEVAAQVAGALAAAHAAGVVHRDIKPENVMVRPDGLVKVLDFGLAKLTAAGPTEADAQAGALSTGSGVVLGTVAYMSPEQARGQPLDGRTDVFSLGVVLYEMVAGERPFAGGTTGDVIAALLTAEPPPLSQAAPRTPHELERMVSQALRKQPGERYQTAGELADDLRRLKQEIESAPQSGRPRASAGRVTAATAAQHPARTDEGTNAGGLTASAAVRQEVEEAPGPLARTAGLLRLPTARRAVALGALAVVLILAALAYLLFFRKTPGESRPAIRSLAVLPLDNLSGDPAQEYLADGMTEALISNLARLGALRVISRTSVLRYKGDRPPLPDIARELNVDAVVEGSVVRAGGRVRVSAQLIHGATDAHLWVREYERDFADVLRLQADVARAVADEIRVQLTAPERARLAEARSINPEAQEAYLRGRHHQRSLNETDLSLAIRHFERAIELAPDYAAAYAGLAVAWQQRGVWGTKPFKEAEGPAREAALKAIELDAENSEARTALGHSKFIYDWDWAGAEEEFKRALELDPGSLNARYYYSSLLMALGRHAEAVSQMEVAEQLDPLSSVTQSLFGRVLYRARRYEEAVPHLLRAIELDPRNLGAHHRLGDVYAEMGRYEEALAEYQKDPEAAASIARVYALMGRRQEALRLLANATSSRFLKAAAYAALGDQDAALNLLEKAVEERSLLVFIKADPRLVSLHTNPRWPALLRRMNFPPD